MRIAKLGAASRFHLDMRDPENWSLNALEDNDTVPFWKDLIEEELTDRSPQSYTQQTIILSQMVRPIARTFLCADQMQPTDDPLVETTSAPSAVIIDFANARRRVAAG